MDLIKTHCQEIFGIIDTTSRHFCKEYECSNILILQKESNKNDNSMEKIKNGIDLRLLIIHNIFGGHL